MNDSRMSVSPAGLLYARRTAGHEARVAHALSILREAAAAHRDFVVQATSLGAEDMVITDLIARHDLGIAVATLDTGKLHDETLALIPRIEARYGLVVEIFRPVTESVVDFVQRHGERAMYDSIALRKACCSVRKLEPLSRMLAQRTAWVSGLRREQSANRAAVPFSEPDFTSAGTGGSAGRGAGQGEGAGHVKFNPIADWSLADVWQYLTDHDVPYNPLHDRFFPSIGCAPCTRAVSVGEDFRSGRWWWEEEGARECGLHEDRTNRTNRMNGQGRRNEG